jgi:hypothetical protein
MGYLREAGLFGYDVRLVEYGFFVLGHSAKSMG